MHGEYSMSTTLTNGLKLPDKGSVDWYADMQNNYAILDGAVGTIADHTTALSGKAPLVHTHTKSDITDFPAYGTTAGTICEGNDSRLSDARTPVAHTHTKSDITDLFNSANTWSGYSTFTSYISSKESAAIPAGGYGKGIAFQDYQNTRLGYIQPYLTSDNAKRLLIGADSGDVAINSSLIPHVSNTYNLGSSSYQWNNVYSKGYYYNGVAWGLNKANVWTANNQFAKINTIETNSVEWHNSHYRGINLISDGHFADMAALLRAIRAQNWSDIYIGDYVELTFTYEGADRTVKFYVGEIDKFYKVGDTSLETHHLVMITGDLGVNQKMNDSNTTAGGYVGSKAHTVTLPALYAILNPLFNNAILTHREHLSNTVLSAQTVSLSLDDGNGAVSYSCDNFPVYSSGDPNTPGCATAGNWYDCNLVLMSEIEMFGSNRFASSGIDDVMCPEGQIAAFKYNRNLQTLNRTINTWLRNVNSASRFCRCNGTGLSDRNSATYANIRLRPRFLIG